jgi:hypothetical protein
VVDADAVENAHRRIISTFSPDQRVPARRDGRLAQSAVSG